MTINISNFTKMNIKTTRSVIVMLLQNNKMYNIIFESNIKIASGLIMSALSSLLINKNARQKSI